jgi:hypothetical protein
VNVFKQKPFHKTVTFTYYEPQILTRQSDQALVRA